MKTRLPAAALVGALAFDVVDVWKYFAAGRQPNTHG